jgi:hypothetical protein
MMRESDIVAQDKKGVFRSLVRREEEESDELIVIANDTRSAIYAWPAAEKMRYTHFVLDFVCQVGGTVGIQAQGVVSSKSKNDSQMFAGFERQDDPSWEQLCQNLEWELHSRKQVEVDGDVVTDLRVDTVLADWSVKRWPTKGKNLDDSGRHLKERIDIQLVEEELRKTTGNRGGPVWVKVRICFLPKRNLALENVVELIQNGACFIAALSIRPRPGSFFKLRGTVDEGDGTVSYGRREDA